MRQQSGKRLDRFYSGIRLFDLNGALKQRRFPRSFDFYGSDLESKAGGASIREQIAEKFIHELRGALDSLQHMLAGGGETGGVIIDEHLRVASHGPNGSAKVMRDGID